MKKAWGMFESRSIVTGQESGITAAQKGTDFATSATYEGERLYLVNTTRGRKCNGGISTLQTLRTMASMAMAAAQDLTCPRHKSDRRQRRGNVSSPLFSKILSPLHASKSAVHKALVAKKINEEKSFRFVPVTQEQVVRAATIDQIEASLSRVRYYAEREEIALRAGKGEVSSRSFVGVGGVV